jgi:hypothetical protein
MLEGELAALSLLSRRGLELGGEMEATRKSLEKLRLGPFGARPRAGKEKVFALMKGGSGG